MGDRFNCELQAILEEANSLPDEGFREMSYTEIELELYKETEI